MACSQTLSGLLNDCAPNIGGIKNAYIANYEDVSEITVTDGKISAITMVTGKTFKKYAFRRGTGSFTSTLNVDPATGINFVSTEIVLQFSRMETTKRVELAALAQSELAIIVEDMNGTFWYFGQEEGVAPSAGTGQTGTARTDGNYYQITLTDNNSSFPLEATSTAVEAVI